jgi:hypothetical protein
LGALVKDFQALNNINALYIVTNVVGYLYKATREGKSLIKLNITKSKCRHSGFMVDWI